MTETRKLAAILVSDVVGYSRLAGVADEERTLAWLRGLRTMTAMTRTPVLPEAAYVGPLSAQLRRSLGGRAMSPVRTNSRRRLERLKRANSRHSVTA